MQKQIFIIPRILLFILIHGLLLLLNLPSYYILTLLLLFIITLNISLFNYML